MGTIDFAHSPGAEQRGDLVGSDAGSAGQGHRFARAFYAIASTVSVLPSTVQA